MEILTPFQKRILTALGRSELASWFYLTGGTALAIYYLQHRFSEDLDFFAVDKEAVAGVTTTLADVAHSVDASVEFRRTFPTFVECFLTSTTGEHVKMDFAFDSPYRLMPTEIDAEYGIQVDNVVDISSNKLAALFGRIEPKDFVDVYFICRELMPFPELYQYASQKHVGMTNYWLAVAMRNVTKVQLLPRMIKPLSLPDMQAFFLELADELMDSMADPLR